MCGNVSAIGLTEPERRPWPHLRERLREPGQCMALMRGVLGQVEVAVVTAVTPAGAVKPLAILALPQEIADEIRLAPVTEPSGDEFLPRHPAKIGDYDVDVLTEPDSDGRPRALAVLASPWIEQHLLLFARKLWHRR